MPKGQVDEQAPGSQAVPVDSEEREGNDANALLGSGTPRLLVRANVGIMDLAAGETAALVQTEEVRLNIANGNLSRVDESSKE